MAEAVAEAVQARRHLVVQAGTGTGKSLAYLVPALVLGQRTVVATATKALQDQLAQRDLPRLSRSLGLHFRWAVLKGRSNYVCRQRVNEITSRGDQMVLGELNMAARQVSQLGREVQRLVQWAQKSGDGDSDNGNGSDGAFSGDRAELSFEPSDAAWAQVSTTWRECPGVAACPSGADCLVDHARRRAADADVVVVNTHLYATSLASKDLDLLPDHDLVVFDEAHELEDIASAALGLELGPGRLASLARAARSLAGPGGALGGLEDAAAQLGAALKRHLDKALPQPLAVEVADAVVLVREQASRLLAELRQAGGSDAGASRQRAQKALSHLVDDANALLELPETDIAWVEGPPHAPVLRTAPLDVGAVLSRRLRYGEAAPTAVLTSATVPPHLGDRLGLAAGSYDELEVGSPFAYSDQALLYCPVHLPDPRAPGFEAAMHEELIALIEAAGGRTLALFTSWRAMQAAAEVVRGRIPWTVYTQSDLPKPKLVAAFSGEEQSCLFATMGFWQGVDVPGASLSLVTIDRVPFPRPDEPLLKARREALGTQAFALVDLPRAATLLAQGAGRLVRSRDDRGAVAVFDRRLGKASYRWELVNALPPMRRTRSRAEVVAFLAALREP